MCTTTKIPAKKIHLAEIYDQHFKAYVKSSDRKLFLTDKHFEAVNKASACRTEKLGIAVFCCEGCGDTQYIFRSCKHRFCSRCGMSDTMKWADKTLSHLLDFKHHHIVFTLPKPFRKLSKKNGNLLSDLLFTTSAQVIKSWFNARHQVNVGIVSVLHTAGSDLKYHPHVHMIVSGGGQIIQTQEYKEIEGDYLCPQKFFGKQFRIKFTQALIKLYDQGKLKTFRSITTHTEFVNWLYKIKQKNWVVSVQKPLKDVAQIVGYVGRYTKRSCISEYKIIEAGETIKFKYNDYKNSVRGQKPVQAIREMTPIDFFDELLQHVPDKRYRMVRYYGIYNAFHMHKIPKELRAEVKEDSTEYPEDYDWGPFEEFRKTMFRLGKPDPLYCSTCKRDMTWQHVLLKGKIIKMKAYEDSS